MKSNRKVTVMVIMWLCHMLLYDVALMQKIKLKFRRNMATIQRKVCQ